MRLLDITMELSTLIIGPDNPTCSQFPSDTEFRQNAKFRKGIWRNNGKDKGKGEDVVKERAGKWLWKCLPCILSVLLVMLEWVIKTWKTGVHKEQACKAINWMRHTYIHTYIRTYIHTYTHTYLPTYLPTYLRTYVRTYAYIHTWNCKHTTQIEPEVLKVPRLPRKRPSASMGPPSSPSFRGHLWRYRKRHACHANRAWGAESVTPAT